MKYAVFDNIYGFFWGYVNEKTTGAVAALVDNHKGLKNFPHKKEDFHCEEVIK